MGTDGSGAKTYSENLGHALCTASGMIIRDAQILLELAALPKDKATPVAFLDDHAARETGDPLLREEFRDWLNVELATFRPRYAQAVRGYLDAGLRKADVEALGISRVYFNKLLTRLAEKWSRASR